MANDTIAERPKRSYNSPELKDQTVAECQVSAIVGQTRLDNWNGDQGDVVSWK
jgi:hypothetical protein